MSRHVFLSPHFDDAIFSCGGTIHQLRQQGQRVLIITVMGGGAPHDFPHTPITQELHARWQAGTEPTSARQREDEEAARKLGAELLRLDVPDCIYRAVNGVPLYPTEAALWGEIHPLDRLQDWLPEDPFTEAFIADTQTLYAPLGVGQHVDHRLVRGWAVALQARHPELNVQFYTDFPYMKDSSKIIQAINNFDLVVQPRWVYLDEHDLSAKVDAMACYESQISTFWADKEAMKRDVHLSFRIKTELWGERYWARA